MTALRPWWSLCRLVIRLTSLTRSITCLSVVSKTRKWSIESTVAKSTTNLMVANTHKKFLSANSSSTITSTLAKKSTSILPTRSPRRMRRLEFQRQRTQSSLGSHIAPCTKWWFQICCLQLSGTCQLRRLRRIILSSKKQPQTSWFVSAVLLEESSQPLPFLKAS